MLIWYYYSDSIDGLKSYSSGSVGYHIMKKQLNTLFKKVRKYRMKIWNV